MSADLDTPPVRFVPPVERPPVRRSTWSLLTPLILRTHFLAGVFVGPFLIIMCLSAMVLICGQQLADTVYRNELFVDSPYGTVQPLVDQITAARKDFPYGDILAVETPASADRTTQVVFDAGGKAMTVYVDPYTATVRGRLVTKDGRPPVYQWFGDLHANLHLGEPGRLYSEAACCWLLVMFGGGVVMWFKRRRGRPQRKETGRALVRKWHMRIGLSLMVGLLALAVTGIVRSPHFGSRVTSVLNGPTVSTAPISGSGALIGVDHAVASASRAGLSGPLRITMATSQGRPYTLAERTVRWPVRADEVTVNPYTGQIADRVRFADAPLVTRVLKLGVLAHSGRLFGLVNQVVELLLMLGTLAVIGLGYRMWWQRGTHRGAPARRGILRTIPWRGRLVVLGGVGAVCWLLPAFGISLALFVVAEAAVSWVNEAPA
jgi:uncharacterized iron-regulated membrane protein